MSLPQVPLVCPRIPPPTWSFLVSLTNLGQQSGLRTSMRQDPLVEISSLLFSIYNQLSGEIPLALGSLPALTSLDLSGSHLSGEIPPAIGNLKLQHLNFSSNQLSGEIPTSLQNQANELSFLDNPGLCSSSNFIKNLGTCEHRSNGSGTLSNGLLILFLILGGVLLPATIVIGTSVLRGYRRRRMDGVDLASWKLKSFHTVDFMERSIISGLTEGNLIGSGGAGKVYRIILGDRAGEIVAVKKRGREAAVVAGSRLQMLIRFQGPGAPRRRRGWPSAAVLRPGLGERS